jgi:glyoxylase-like metal-dependent hydrolase (beta-lactamase superfamily II)
MKRCKLYLNNAGYCLAKGSKAVKGEKNRDIQFKALFALIQHPHQGWILFDTGYSGRFYQATRFLPNKIYALITKVFIDEDQGVKAQLKRAGIDSQEIRHVIISHFHADHIGGLKDFNNATFYCSRGAYRQLKEFGNLLAFSKGILKELIPEDFESRLKFTEETGGKKEDAIFGIVSDIFNDNSILVHHLPGHAAGQTGILLQTHRRRYFLVADACWDKRAYLDLKLPHPIVRLFFHSWKQYKETINKLKLYQQLFPEVLIVPSHCSSTTDKIINSNLNMNEL